MDKIVKCMYCGTEVNFVDSNNPYDNGLHEIKSKYSEQDGACCCTNCNIITAINRNLKRIIDEPQDINIAIFHIEEELAVLKKNRQSIFEYYMNAKAKR